MDSCFVSVVETCAKLLAELELPRTECVILLLHYVNIEGSFLKKLHVSLRKALFLNNSYWLPRTRLLFNKMYRDK